MGKRAETTHKGPLQLAKSCIGQPPPGFYTRPMLHIDCTGRVEVEGCRGVLLFNEERLALDMGRWQVSLCGDGLVLEGLTRRSLQIRGTLLRVELSTAEEGAP